MNLKYCETLLTYTPRLTEGVFGTPIPHLKIETRLIDERFASVMGECEVVTLKVRRLEKVLEGKKEIFFLH